MAGKVKVREESTEGASAAEALLDDLEGGILINFSAEYAMYVEFPTSYSGSPPPFQPIYKWVQRKWGDLDSDLKTDEDGNELSQEEVARKVQQIIFQYGTEGVYFGNRALAEGESRADSIASKYSGSGDPEAGEKALADIGRLMFSEANRIISEEATDTGNLLQSGSIEYFEDPDEVPEAEGESFEGGP